MHRSSPGAALALGLFWLSLGACGDSAEGPEDVSVTDATSGDASVSDAGAEADGGPMGPRVQVGTGQDEFRPLVSGQRVEFFQGPQSSGDPIGGYHVWGAVRGEGLNPAGATVSFELTSRDGAETLGTSASRRVALLPDASGGFVAYGFPAILEDCCAVRDRELRFRVRVVDADQRTLTDEVDVLGATDCLNLDRQSVCP